MPAGPRARDGDRRGGKHLAVLREAGRLDRARDGRSVLDRRAPRGRARDPLGRPFDYRFDCG
ncbi:hypothetical protein E1165_12300 [Micromonospora sp. KC723]|nr:hypothetical protein E1165_12300 [Micromonospora sp. KC723]